MARKLNSRDKGKVGERELAGELSRIFGTSCRRGQQYSGLDGSDVVGLPGIHIESKRVEKLNIYTAVEQSERDAKENETPVVFHRRNRKPWLVTFYLEDLPRLVGVLSEILCKESKPLTDCEESPS